MSFVGISWNIIEHHGISLNILEHHGTTQTTVEYLGYLGILRNAMVHHGTAWNAMEYHGKQHHIMEYNGISWIIILGKHPWGSKAQIWARRLSGGYPDLWLLGRVLWKDLGIHAIIE